MRGRTVWWVCLILALGRVGRASAALPEEWSSRDINTTGGSASEAGGTWTISGDGADVWSSSDAFHFVYRTLSGSGEITARVVSYGSGSSTWSKGGVMIRETLARDSRHAMMAITGGNGGGLAFQNRPTSGGRSYTAHGNPVAAPPYWVRLTREGDTITAYSSVDGVHWVQQPDGSDSHPTQNPVTIPMAANVLVGLFVCSGVAGEVRTYTFDGVTVERRVTALQPEPADGAVYADTWTDLSWAAGWTAASHDVYFGESFADVNDGTGGTFQGNQPLTHFVVGRPAAPCPDGLVPGTTYYWRVDEVESDGVTKHRGQVWRFFVPPREAYAPEPRDGAQFVATDVVLTWAPGLGAGWHTFQFGADFEAVANAKGGRLQALTEYRLGTLEPGKTYYWRVDESQGRTTYRGEVWSFTTRPAELASAAIYYVDANHPDARDLNPGTEARPWKTIGRGTQALQPGDVLLIKAGTYREGVILARSGTAAKPIRIWAYPGDEGKAIINAAEPVAGWQKCVGPEECAGNAHWDHIYYADVARLVDAHESSGFAIRQVFQHGQLLPRSRFPDAGWRNLTGVVDPRTTFNDIALISPSRPNGYFNGSVCHIKTAPYHPDQIEIVDYSRGVIALADSPRFDIVKGLGYYLTNVVGEINAEGEWAYDPAQKRLFLWPKEDTPEDIEITYRRFCLRTYSGTSFNEVQGLTMRNAYESGIWLYQACNMKVENNTVEHSFNCGIFLQATDGTCADNCILNNTIRYSCSTGIALDGTTRDNRIEGNTVYASGTDVYGGDVMNGRGEGIRIGGRSARVYNNRVDCTALTSVYLSGAACGREVSYNYLTNACLAGADGGSIYTGSFGNGPETDSIDHNIIVDVFGCWAMNKAVYTGQPPTVEAYAGASPGIYIDEEGNQRIIEHNTVIRSYMAGIYFHWAPGNVVRHNTLYDNREIQTLFEGKNEGMKRLVDNDLFDNIMFSTNAQQKTFFLQIEYDDVHFGRADNNWFYNPYADQHIRVDWYGPYRREDMTLDRWRALSGYDENSKDFAYLDRLSDVQVDLAKPSRIIYNPSLEAVTVDLGQDKYCDVQGNKIYGDVTLPPFESKILIPADYAVSVLSSGGEGNPEK